MDRKQSVIANVRYQTPKGKGASKLKGLLRYVQYRDDRDGHIPQHRGLERWTDKGLGGDFQTIAANCDRLKSDHVQAFCWVMNPNPDLVAMMPEKQREAFARELTETTMERFFEARGIDTPEYAYAIHRRETTDSNRPGRDNPHAHVVLPGTFDSWADGARLPLYMNQNKRENHIELLHGIAQQQIGSLMERYVGLDWEQRYDALLADRERVAELATQAAQVAVESAQQNSGERPHGILHDDDGSVWRLWVATRDVGFIMQRDDKDGKVQEAFVSQAEGLSLDEADQSAQGMVEVMKRDWENGVYQAIKVAEDVNMKKEDEPEEPEIRGADYSLDL